MSLTNVDDHGPDEQDTHSSLDEGTAESDEASFYTCYSAYTNPQRLEVDLDQNDTVHGSEGEESQRLLSSGETSPQPGFSGDRFANIDRFRPWFPQCDPEHPRAMTMSVRLKTNHCSQDSNTSLSGDIGLEYIFDSLGCNEGRIDWRYGDDLPRRLPYRQPLQHRSPFGHQCPFDRSSWGEQLLFADLDCPVSETGRNCPCQRHMVGHWCPQRAKPIKYQLETTMRMGDLDAQLSSTPPLVRMLTENFELEANEKQSWNSALYYSTPVFVYTTAVVSTDFQSNRTPWSDSLEALENLQRNINSLKRINNIDYIGRYMDALGSPRDLVIVTSEPGSAFQPNSSLIIAFQNPAQGENWFRGPRWICSEVYHKFKNDEKQCTVDLMQDHSENWKIWMEPLPDPLTVEYCLSAGVQATKHCDVRYNISIGILIFILNFCKCVCIVCTKRIHAESRLVTVGDAVASFLEEADMTTKQLCLATVHTMKKVGGLSIESSAHVSKIKKAGVWFKKHVSYAVRAIRIKEKSHVTTARYVSKPVSDKEYV